MFKAFFADKFFSFFLSLFLFAFFFAGVVRSQTDESNSDSAANQNQAIALFERGQDVHEKGDLAGALKLYEEALKLFPEFPEGEYQRGSALNSLGKLEDAEKAFRRAIELRADWSLAWAKLGEVLVKRHSKISAAADNTPETNQLYGETVKVLQKAIELDESNFPAFVALTELRLRYKTADNTLRELLTKIQLVTEGKATVPASVWAARGALERALKDYQSAKKSLRRALSIDPNNTIALVARGQLLAAEGDTEAAIVDLQSAVKTMPPDASWRAQVLLINLMIENGKIEEARAGLDSIDEQFKNQPEIINLKNRLIVAGATGSEGVESLERALKTDAKNVAVLSRLCSLTRTLNPQKSLEYCRRAAEADPYQIKHAIGYGAALIQAKQFDAAAVLFRKLLEVEPKNYTARANLAIALYELKRYKESIAEFHRLMETNPDSAVAYYFMATAYDYEGDYVAALAAYQKFLQLAKPEQNQLEIDKVKLRLPAVVRQVEKGARGKKP